jgi:hypothetical protein
MGTSSQNTPIRFKEAYSTPISRTRVKAKKRNIPKEPMPLRIFLEKVAIGFIRLEPLSIFIKGKPVKAVLKSVGEAKAYVCNNYEKLL